MNRKLLSVLIAIVSSMAASAQNESDVYFTATTVEGVEVSYRIPAWSDRYCEIGGPSENGYPAAAISTTTKGSVTIPKEVSYNGRKYGVTRVDMASFQECHEITSVTLPESVGGIGMSAFSGCWKLKSVTLPKKVTSDYFWTDDVTFFIGEDAFGSCSALTDVELPEGTAELLPNVFSGCDGLQSITLPATLKSIDYGVFNGCSGLEKIIVRASVPPTLTDADVFADCSGATLCVPQGTKADYLAAPGWNKLANITEVAIDCQDGDTFVAKNDDGLPITYKVLSAAEKTCQVGDGASTAFAQETTGEVSIPASVNGFTVKAVGDGAFSNCQATFIAMPEGIDSIGDYAFLNDFQMTRIVLPRGLTTIGRAIVSCRNLEYLYWPKSITMCTLPTVDDCPKLARIETDDNTYGDCNAVVSGSNIELGCKNTIIPEGITGISAHAFYGCTGLTAIELPSTLRWIGENAFDGCTGLTAIVLPKNVKRIERHAFRCNKLTEVKALMHSPATINAYSFPERSGMTLYVPWDCKDAYEPADYWKDFKTIVELDPAGYVKGDVDGDGVVDIADAVRIVNLVVGKIDTLSRQPNKNRREPQ